MRKVLILLSVLYAAISAVAQSEQANDTILHKLSTKEYKELPQMSLPSSFHTPNDGMSASQPMEVDSMTFKVPPLPAYTPSLPFMDIKTGYQLSDI